MSLTKRCADLAAEVAALRMLISGVDRPSERVTPFHGWRVRDSIEHIVMIDRLATLAFSDPQAFAEEMAVFIAGTAGADRFGGIAGYETLRLGLPGWDQLLAVWDTGFAALEKAALAHDPDDKIVWFGGSMRADSLLSARHMEVWAYGQDVFDGCGIRRPETDRIRTVVEFGLKTFGFAFANRGEAVPPSKPYVRLISPEGSAWEWNAPGGADRIEGSAVDFCLVTTQRRHVEDTALHVIGETATRWMRIAQCIAGPPMDGPAPAERTGPV